MRWLIALLLLVCAFAANADTFNYATRQLAYEACQADYSGAASSVGGLGYRFACTQLTPASPYRCSYYNPSGNERGCSTPRGGSGTPTLYVFAIECPAGSPWNDSAHTCDLPCGQRPPLPPASGSIVGTGTSPATCGTDVCVNGCVYSQTGLSPESDQVWSVLDGHAYCKVDGYPATGATCTTGPTTPTPETPPTDTDGDGTSDGNDGAPENPGEGVPPTDPGQPPTCGGPGQPECKSSGGDKEKNMSSGGGDCRTPPSSSGDAILGQIAYQTWATRCAIANGAGDGSVNGGKGDGTGTGDGFGPDDKANLQAIKDALTDQTQFDPGPDGNPGDSYHQGEEPPDPDDNGYGWSRTCPQSPTFEVFGTVYTIDIAPACDWIALGGLIAVALTALGCIRILGQGVS